MVRFEDRFESLARRYLRKQDRHVNIPFNTVPSPNFARLRQKIQKASAPIRGPYNRYFKWFSKADRISIIAEAIRTNNTTAVANQVGMPPRTLRQWVLLARSPVGELPHGRKQRRAGGGRKPVLTFASEYELYRRIRALRVIGAPINYSWIKAMAIQRAELEQIPDFEASPQWYRGFLKRWRYIYIYILMYRF